MNKRAFLFDGNSFCYRAFYAIAHLSNSKGQPTNAIYGFLTMIQRLISQEKPDYCAVCFDSKEKTFRHKKYEAYKSHRKPMPEDLVVQMPRIKEVVSALNIPIFEEAGVEADDVLGTMARQLAEQGIEVFIVTGDKDALQLVTNDIKVYSSYRDKVTIYNPQKVTERFDGLCPGQITDLMGLMGDASDNIPGVPGIGEKIGVSYIKEFGSLDNLFQNVDKIKSKKKQALLAEYREQALLSKDLATIDTHVPITVSADVLVMREPDETRLVVLYKEFEFKKLLEGVHGETVKETGRHYHVVSDAHSLEALVEKLKTVSAFSFDTETTGVNPLTADLVGLSFSFKDKEAYYIVLSHEAIATQKGLPLAEVLTQLRPILENDEIRKYGQNIKYDAMVMRRYTITLRGIAFDTMLAAYLINPAKLNQNLDSIALEYLNVKKISFVDVVGSGKTQKRIDEVEVQRVVEYACEDADVVWRLVPILRKQLQECGLESLFADIEMPLARVLETMEINGVYLDTAFLRTLSKRAEKEIAKLEECIYRDAGEEFNINSPKQLGVVLFEKLKLPVVKKTKTGYSTDVSVLEALQDRHPLPAHLIAYREFAKLKSTYLDALPELVDSATGLVHTSFNQTVTVTGRLSSSSPNVQNIPIKTEMGREIRKAFVPRSENRVIVGADYSQVELRLLAHFSGDEKLCDAFRRNSDVHTYTATLLYDVEEDAVTSEMRHLAKTVNFSIIYGKTPFGLSRDLGIPLNEARAFIEAYFHRYPSIKTYLDKQVENARDKGYVTTILGRRAYFPNITSSNGAIRQFSERAAMNAPLQGSAADLIKKAMITIDAALQEKQLDALMILQVHDELVFDVAQEDVDAVVALIGDAMENALPLDVPLKVDVYTGASWCK